MARAIWTKLRNDPNGNWSRHEGEPPFSIPVVGGMYYDVYTDAGDSFVIMPQIAAEAPKLSGAPVVEGTFEVGQTLTAIAAPATGTPPIATAWQWLRDGVEIIGATDVTYALKNADEGKAIAVRQSDSNAHGTDSATSEAVTVAPVIPVVTAPVISGLPTIAGIAEVGQTLTAAAAPSIGTDPIDTALQWLRDGTEIAGATDATYALTAADEDKAIAVRQTDTNAQGSDSATSETVTVTVIPVATAPVISGLPTFAGIAEVGQTLTAATAPATGTDPIETTWQWLRDGEPNSGEQNETYLLTDLDEGTEISVRQRSTNIYGTHKATSEASTVKAASVKESARIIELSVSDQDASGEISIVYTITGDSVVSGVVTRFATTPEAAQIVAGRDHNNEPADSIFSDNWTINGSDTLPDVPIGLPFMTYYLHVLPERGGDSDVVTSNGFALETVRPTVVSAATNTDGNQITLTLSEEVLGTPDASNWTVNGVSAGAPTISTPVISGNTITLPISGNLIASGDKVTVEYTGGDIDDVLSNDLRYFTGSDAKVLQNNVPAEYSEKLVTVAPGANLLAPAGAPTGTSSFLFFFSGFADTTPTGRSVLASWDPNWGLINARHDGPETGIRAMVVSGKSVSGSNENITFGTRYHAIVSAWTSGARGTVTLKASIRKAGGSWAYAFSSQTAAADLDTLHNIVANPQRLFQRVDGGGAHDWYGQCARIAMWTAIDKLEIKDPMDPDLLSWLVDPITDEIVDPAIAREAGRLGLPLYDFNGPASRYNTGNHDGLLGIFTKTGTFS